jgi:small subunit ribosomal protein S22
MFTDNEKLHSLLDREKYEFVLDRACLQYDPDEASYQRITSITYQHIDMNKNYDMIRYYCQI